MHKPVKYVEKILTIAAGAAFETVDFFTRSEKPSFTPKWSDKPLLKSSQKSKPPLGWPRRRPALPEVHH